MSSKAEKVTLPDLPPKPQVGDRIKLKPERAIAFYEACTAAGYLDFTANTVHEVKRIDEYAPGGGRRLFVERQPFCFTDRDVILAWNTNDERRLALRALGWRV